jgi:hypothetical protein
MQRFLGVAIAAIVLGVVAGAGLTPVQGVSAQATGTVTIQKNLVDAMNQPVNVGNRAFEFVLTLVGTQVTTRVTTDATTGMASVNVAPGTYTIAETNGQNLVSLSPGNSFALGAGATVNVVATNRVAGTSTLTISKTVVDANNVAVVGADLSGFVFSVTATGYSQTVTTPAGGSVTLSNLAAGTYTVTEQARAGYTFAAASVDDVASGMVATFNLALGQTRTVRFANRQGAGTGTVQITKQLVDASGNVTTGTVSGFTFTVQCAASGTTTAFTATAVTDVSGNASVGSVPAGTCTIQETVPTGFTFVSATPAGSVASTTNPTTFTATAGQTLSIVVRNRTGTGGGTGTTEPVSLFAGCNNVALTWTAGTPITTVAAAISPAGALESIWRYDNASGQFAGFSPNPNAPSDYRAVQIALEPVFVCMRAPATLSRPAV